MRCALCGGNVGFLNEQFAHNACSALAELGLPTPCLGMRCAACDGRGRTPKSPVGPALFFEGSSPGSIGRAIDAWAPECAACGGKGYTDA